jgi:tRNA G10  N-methylase Trm11
MRYKYIENANFEDYAGGRVLYQQPGCTNFPVRLACEIFERCLEALNETERKICVYDPCCGGGYLLTVLGFLYNNNIASIIGSDISEEALSLAEKNLGLLTVNGLSVRQKQLQTLYNDYGKESHVQAVNSANNLRKRIKNEINRTLFVRDVLDSTVKLTQLPKADIIITDVPYGKLTAWPADNASSIDKMLDTIKYNLNENAVAAVSSDKRQKINHPQYMRVEKFIVGKRKVEIVKLI